MTSAVPPAEPCDVLVMGGGPAGSTAAMLLARQGRRVTVLEKAHHPRFHIGESLLPANVALFEQLGLRQEIERIGMPKYGAEFCSPAHSHRATIEFGDAWDKTMPYAWQVRRSEMDEILFRRAAQDGATTVEGCQVREVRFDDPACPDGVVVRATMDDGAERLFHARYLVDATGRDTFMANRLKIKQRNERHNSSSLFAHYRGAFRHEGRQAGHITIFWFAHGWFWYIPLADGTTSVGVVCWPYYLKTRGGKPMAEFWADTVALCPMLAERLQGAELVDGRVHATGNFAYSASQCCGDRFVMLGDAYAFIDPVFSSGVYLAMMSAFKAVDLVATALDRPAQVAAAQKRFTQQMRFGPREFSWFIYRVTNPTMRDFFMNPANPFRVKEALISLLAGDIFGRTPIWTSLTILKGLYYLVSLQHLRRTWTAWQRRRVNIQDHGPMQGETVLGR